MYFRQCDQIYAKPKDRIAEEQRKDAIYSIPCNDCNHAGVYISIYTVYLYIYLYISIYTV